MLPRRGRRLSRSIVRPSFAGTGLLERVRSTTFALLGITAAMGLSLVAIVSQQAWPELPGLPLPGVTADRGEVHGAVRVAIRPSAVAQLSLAPRSRGADRHLGTGPGERTVPVLLGSRKPAGTSPSPQTEATPVAPTGQGGPVQSDPSAAVPPGGSPAPAPPTQTQTQASAPVSTTPSPPPPKSGDSHSQGKGHAYGKSKSVGAVPHGKPSQAEAPPPVAPAPPAAPPAEAAGGPAATPAEETSPGNSHGNGKGHAYGQLGR